MEDSHSLFKKSVLNLILGLMLLTIIGASADTVIYILNTNFLLVYLNMFLVVLLLGTSIAAFFEKINLRVTTYIFSYSILANIVTTNFYLKSVGSPTWELSFLRDTPIVFMFMIFISMVLTKSDLIMYIILVTIYHGAIVMTSSSNFIANNMILITITIIGGAIVIYWITNLLKKAMARNDYLERKLREQRTDSVLNE
jgi:hypothetical protein